MNPFLLKIEEVLKPLAIRYTPERSDPVTVIHHWTYAIANNEKLTGINQENDKKEIMSALKENCLFHTTEQFRKNIYDNLNFPPVDDPKFRFIDLFSGIGGFRLALQSMRGLCVFSSEWDKYAQQTYLNNYGELLFGDITKVDNGVHFTAMREGQKICLVS